MAELDDSAKGNNGMQRLSTIEKDAETLHTEIGYDQVRATRLGGPDDEA